MPATTGRRAKRTQSIQPQMTAVAGVASSGSSAAAARAQAAPWQVHNPNPNPGGLPPHMSPWESRTQRSVSRDSHCCGGWHRRRRSGGGRRARGQRVRVGAQPLERVAGQPRRHRRPYLRVVAVHPGQLPVRQQLHATPAMSAREGLCPNAQGYAASPWASSQSDSSCAHPALCHQGQVRELGLGSCTMPPGYPRPRPQATSASNAVALRCTKVSQGEAGQTQKGCASTASICAAWRQNVRRLERPGHRSKGATGVVEERACLQGTSETKK